MLLAQQDRRSFLLTNVGVAGVVGLSPTHTAAAAAAAAAVSGSEDVLSGLLSDLPPEAARSYLQYRIPLQISADYYMWDLQVSLFVE